VVIALLGVIIAGAGFVVAAGSVAGGYRESAERALQQARTDDGQVATSMRSPDLGSRALGDFDDAASYRRSMSVLRGQLKGLNDHTRHARSVIDLDLPDLRRESDRLHSASDAALLWPARGSLQAERQRVESVIEGFTAARQALDILLDQDTAASAVVGAMDQFAEMVELEERGDPGNALVLSPHVESVVRRAAMVSASPNVPQRLHKLMTAMMTLVTDNKLLVQAALAGDEQAGDAAVRNLDVDQHALAFDARAFQAEEDAFSRPHLNRYEAAVGRAGFHHASR
jgi:hypothetical protein